LVSLLKNWLERRRSEKDLLSRVFGRLNRLVTLRRKKRFHLKLFLSCLSGLTLGIVINPYFHQNLIFYYHQLVKIGIINYQKVIGVGGEWYPYHFMELVSNTVFVSIPVIIALVLFFVNLKRQSKRSITLLIIYLFFLIFTLKSRRYVEYYVPFGVLFAASSITDSLANLSIRKYLSIVGRVYKRSWLAKIGLFALVIYLLIMIPAIAVRDLRTEKNDLSNGFAFDKFSGAMEWLKAASPAGSIVLHGDWDEFPLLFYHNDHNYYIVGLDPTFGYEYDQDFYLKWVDITTGKEIANLYETIKSDFRASYVFLEKDHAAMDRLIRGTNGFRPVYEDNESKIYQVESSSNQ
jgi:hypothetical protein